MTREEEKVQKYIENQRDTARREAAGLRVELAEAKAALALARAESDDLRVQGVRLLQEKMDLTTDVYRLREELLVVRNENNGLTAEAVNDAHLYQLALAKLDAVRNDVDSTASLKKRLAAKSEELRLALNELGALKAKTTAPKSLDGMIADAIRLHGPDAVIGHIMSSKVRP